MAFCMVFLSNYLISCKYFRMWQRALFTPILNPIRYRTEYKLLLLTFKAIHHLAPSYLAHLLQLYHPTRTLRSSSDSLMMARKTHNRHYGDRAFCVAAPKLWNNLPLYMRECGFVHRFNTPVTPEARCHYGFWSKPPSP